MNWLLAFVALTTWVSINPITRMVKDKPLIDTGLTSRKIDFEYRDGEYYYTVAKCPKKGHWRRFGRVQLKYLIFGVTEALILGWLL